MIGESPYRVVVVEDDLDSLELLVLALQAAGFAAHGAEDIAGARRIVEDVRPHALVADYTLPDGTGADLLASCSHARPQVCILLTGFDAVDVGPTGFDFVLTKPVRTELLIETLRKNVSRSS